MAPMQRTHKCSLLLTRVVLLLWVMSIIGCVSYYAPLLIFSNNDVKLHTDLGTKWQPRDTQSLDRLPENWQRQEEQNKQEAERNLLDRLKEMGKGRSDAEIENALQDLGCRRLQAQRGIILGPKEPCENIENIVNDLATGTYRFNKPQSAFVYESVKVVLSLATTPVDLSHLEIFRNTKGEIAEKKAQYAQHIEAILRGGPSVEISPSGPQERTVTSLDTVDWEWNVILRERGTQHLRVEVFAHIIMPPKEARVRVQVLEQDIEVHVSWMLVAKAAITSVGGIIFSVITMIMAITTLTRYLSPRKIPVVRWLLRRGKKPEQIEIATDLIRQDVDTPEPGAPQ